jgi:hypothetical protein
MVPAKITPLLTAVGASLAAARLLRGLGFGIAVEIAAGLAIAADPALASAQVSGMEIMLSSALAPYGWTSYSPVITTSSMYIVPCQLVAGARRKPM